MGLNVMVPATRATRAAGAVHAGHGEGVALGVGVVGGEVGRDDDDVGVLGARGASSVATGASSTQVTLTVACAGSEPPWPSPTV